jgi:hypothetical protein
MPTRSRFFLTMVFLLVCFAGGIRVQVSDLLSGFAEPGIVPMGWVRAGDLVPGDQLLGEDGQEVTVESIAQTEQFEKVYNLRVAANHTYFVGSDGWGFSVWVHNARCIATPNGYIENKQKRQLDCFSMESSF